MKKSNFFGKFIMITILMGILAYFGYVILAFFMDPYSINVAYRYVGENSVTVSGYVVRDEKALDADGDLIYYSRREGERVSKGGSVALLYSSEEAFRAANELRALEEQLQQLLDARELAVGIQSTAKLDAQVSQALSAFHAARAGGDLADLSDAADAVRAAVLRYNYAYTGTDELERTIADLQEEIQTLKSSVSGATTAVRAPAGGLFSSLVDGYESVLTPDALETMTVAEFERIEPLEPQGIGKMVHSYKWYFVTVLSQKDAKLLKTGGKVTLRFTTGLDRDLTLQTERIGSAEDGQCLVVFSSDENVSMTTLLRRQTAQIVFESYSGIRVPRSAVRVTWETARDKDGNVLYNEDGTEKQTQVYGVYCIVGSRARFKTVDIIWQEDEFMIVQSTEEAQQSEGEALVLREGDQVITAAGELYDGKVID